MRPLSAKRARKMEGRKGLVALFYNHLSGKTTRSSLRPPSSECSPYTYLCIARRYDRHSVTVPRMGSSSPYTHRHRETRMIVSTPATYVRSLISDSAVVFREGRARC